MGCVQDRSHHTVQVYEIYSTSDEHQRNRRHFTLKELANKTTALQKTFMRTSNLTENQHNKLQVGILTKALILIMKTRPLYSKFQ